MIFIKIRLTNFRVNQKENNSKLLQLLMKKKLKIDFFERFLPPFCTIFIETYFNEKRLCVTDNVFIAFFRD